MDAFGLENGGHKRPKYNDDIKVNMVKKSRRLYAYRDFQIKDKEGNIIVIGNIKMDFC